MLPAITLKASLARAWSETKDRLDLRKPAQRFVAAVVGVLAWVGSYLAHGRSAALAALPGAILGVFALVLVGLATFVANLILAPYRLAYEAAADAHFSPSGCSSCTPDFWIQRESPKCSPDPSHTA